MDEAIVARWNARIGPDDEVWHLGDVWVKGDRPPSELLPRLAGRKHLIIGNHDEKRADVLEALRPHFVEVAHIHTLEAGGQRIALCHYPLRDWWKMGDGAWHLFGHVHGELDAAPHGRSMDVGVDSHGFAPVSLDEVAARLAPRPVESERVRTTTPAPSAPGSPGTR